MASPTPTPTPKVNNGNSQIYQNSYRLRSKNKFNVLNVKAKIKNILDMNLQDVELAEQSLSDLCTVLAEDVKNGIKDEKYDRYRIIVLVTIGEKLMQGIRTCHSFLWDRERDNFADFTFETNNHYVQVVVYGIYFD